MLLKIEDKVPWEEFFFEAGKENLLKKGASLEDRRIADWQFLLPVRSGAEALVVGIGLGTLPVALAGSFGRVYAADTSSSLIDFLKTRKEQQCLEALQPIQVWDLDDLRFPQSSLDLISINPEEQRGLTKERKFTDIIDFLKEFIAPNGILQLTVGNRFAAQNWFRTRRKNNLRDTLSNYRRVLKKSGFRHLEIYAPLPHFDGIPLFYLPLHSPQVIDFFLKKVLPLMEMVSPEAKRTHAVEYWMSKMFIGIAIRLRLARLIPYFVSGYCIIAHKD